MKGYCLVPPREICLFLDDPFLALCVCNTHLYPSNMCLDYFLSVHA